MTTAGAGDTTKFAVQVLSGSQALVTVYVMLVVPPQAGGAVPPELFMDALQPPEKEAVAFHAANLVSIAAWV